MELKKSDKANIDKNRGIFTEIGFLIALGLALLAFEWTVEPKEDENDEFIGAALIEEEQVAITRHDEPPPPPPEPPKVTDILDIVADDVTVDTNIHIDIEIDLNTEIFIPDMFSVAEVEEEEETVLFHIVEDKPMFNGKDADVGFREWVNSKIVYPPIASENGISGRVIMDFAIDRDGNVTEIRVLRGADPLLDAEVMRVLRMSPKWTPGKQRGKPVKVRYQFPFMFQLQ